MVYSERTVQPFYEIWGLEVYEAFDFGDVRLIFSLQSDSLRSYLRIVLFQCFESLVDSQWELRRMGHQVQNFQIL